MEIQLLDKKINKNSGVSTILIISGLLIFCIPFTKWFMQLETYNLDKVVAFVDITIGFLMLYYGCKISGEKKERRWYIQENGEFDLNQRRRYEPYKGKGFLSIIGGYPQKGKFIKFFEFNSGIVTIQTNNKKSLTAPLSQLKVFLEDDKNGMEHAYIILRYGDKQLKVLHNSILYDEWEIEDMNKILSYASEVKVSKWTKAKIPNIFSMDTVPVMSRQGGASLPNLFSEDRQKFRVPLDDEGVDNEIEEFQFDVPGHSKYIIDKRTDQEKKADAEIFNMIHDVKSKEERNASVSEDAVRTWITDSSKDGFETLFNFYDIVRRHNSDNTNNKVLTNSKCIKKVWNIYKDYRYLEQLGEENMWLAFFCGALIVGWMIVGMIALSDLSFWNYVVGVILMIVVWLTVLCLLQVPYSDKLENIQKIFLDCRMEVLKTGTIQQSEITVINRKLTTLVIYFRILKCINWALGLGLIGYYLWQGNIGPY